MSCDSLELKHGGFIPSVGLQEEFLRGVGEEWMKGVL
jgi:hypothetical protein